MALKKANEELTKKKSRELISMWTSGTYIALLFSASNDEVNFRVMISGVVRF